MSSHGRWMIHHDDQRAVLHCKCGWSEEVLPEDGERDVLELARRMVEQHVDGREEQR